MVSAGAVDPRRSDDVPSITQLARLAGLSVETVRRMIRGRGTPDPANVAKVADALGVDRRKVARWVNVERAINDTWEPPSESALLNDEERDAVNRLIRLLVAGRKSRPVTKLSDRRPTVADVIDLPSAAEPVREDRGAGEGDEHHGDGP